MKESIRLSKNTYKPTILICLCHYNNKEDILNLINNIININAFEYATLFISISDNSKNWETTENNDRFVSIYEPDKNLGYLAGCCFAMESWIAQYQQVPEWTSITNADITFAEDFFALFSQLASKIDNEQIRIIAPNIITLDHVHQNPYMIHRPNHARMKRLLFFTSNKLLFIYYNLLHLTKKRFVKQQHSSIRERDIYAPHGSIILLHHDFFSSSVNLKSELFLWGEEILIAEQARLHNMRIKYIPELIVYHAEHATVGKIPRDDRRKLHNRNLRFLYETYWNNKN